MSGATLDGIPPSLWRRAARARHRLLMLDYDGTLAPFRTARMEARPLPGILNRIERVSMGGRTTFAVVSGRPIRELDRLLPRVPAHLAGEHGWEIRLRGGRLIRRALPRGARAALERAARDFERAGLGANIERKRTSLVLHVRGLSAARRARLECEYIRIWKEEGFSERLALARTNGGLELKVTGRDKGTAVRDLLEASPPGVLPIYIGDDETDEDAFRAVRRIGFGVRVGRVEKRASLAAGRLGSCTAVRAFLDLWARKLEGLVP